MTNDSGTAMTRPPNQPGPFILVVDDDPLVLETLILQFRNCGFRPQGATSADKAIGLCELTPFTVAIIDYRMPRCGGDHLAAELKSRFGMPCILLTGMDDEETRAAALRADVALYLVKPVDTATLLGCVSEVLREA